MTFKDLCNYFVRLERTTSGNKMREILGEMYDEVGPDEIREVSYLVLGHIGPEFEDLPIGLAEQMMRVHNDTALVHRLVENGYKTVTERFTPEAHTAKIMEGLERMWKNKKE